MYATITRVISKVKLAKDSDDGDAGEASLVELWVRPTNHSGIDIGYTDPEIWYNH
jgi:hypothetical protein